MKCGGIIAEYNPFHNGHAWQIEKFRKTGVDVVVVCLSGNYVQRGEPAFIDKFQRANMAIWGGADLVLELPIPYAVSSAERFAGGAVSLLTRIGASDLCFGTENGEIEPLRELADFFNSAHFLQELQLLHEKGMSFPRAREEIVKEIFPEKVELLKGSNNILAIEYLRAINRQKSPMNPVTFQRKGADHGGRGDGIYGSGSYIRESLKKGDHGALVLMPEKIAIQVKKIISEGFVPDDHKWEVAILSTLKRMKPENFRKVPDCNEGFEYRMEKAVAESTSLDMLYAKLKSKRYTMSRIQRVVLMSYLGIPSNLSAAMPPYLRVLAMNEQGQRWLKERKDVGGEMVHTRFGILANEYPKSKSWTELESLGDDLYTLLLKNPQPSASDYLYSVRPTEM